MVTWKSHNNPEVGIIIPMARMGRLRLRNVRLVSDEARNYIPPVGL